MNKDTPDPWVLTPGAMPRLAETVLRNTATYQAMKTSPANHQWSIRDLEIGWRANGYVVEIPDAVELAEVAAECPDCEDLCECLHVERFFQDALAVQVALIGDAVRLAQSAGGSA